MRVRRAILFAVIALAAAACARKEGVKPTPSPSAATAEADEGPPKISVIYARLLVGNQYLEVRYNASGMRRVNPEPTATYVLDEATGEKFYVAWLRRIGRVATTRAGTQYMLVRNKELKLKPGSKVTVVVGPATQEHVTLLGEKEPVPGTGGTP